jgi:hypothetical protein
VQCFGVYLEALDRVLERLVRRLELLSLGTQLFQEASSIAEDGDLVGLGRLPRLQDCAELIEPGGLHDREVDQS